jgi:hypothetical protein
MTKSIAVCWLVLELLVVAVLAWAEFGLGTWSSATHETISASPDAGFQIRFLSWTSAVALGCLMGLGFGAAMLAVGALKSRPKEVAQRLWAVPAWLLAVMPIIPVIAVLTWRHMPWLV